MTKAHQKLLQRRSLVATVAGFAVLVGACGQLGPSSAEGAGNETSALQSEVRLIDAPSTPAIVLRWLTPSDGQKDTATLEFEVENTTGQPVDLKMEVISQASFKTIRSVTSRARLQAHETAARSTRVQDLGVQLVGRAAQTYVIATYTGNDGVVRSAPLTPVWVEHQADFATARVRGEVVEANANAQRRVATTGPRAIQDGRLVDAARGLIDRLDKNSPDLAGTTELIAQTPDLPDIQALRAAAKRSVLESTGLPDAERSDWKVDESIVNKGGLYQVCMNLGVFYADARFGEDYLATQGPSTVGQEPARYMASYVMNSAGQYVHADFLNAGGCTPQLNLANGTYTAGVALALYRSGTDVGIDVTNDDTKQFFWGTTNFSVSGSGGVINLYSSGYSALSDAAAAAGASIARSTFHYANGTHTDIFVAQSCPGMTVPTGCASGNRIWLGSSPSGFPYALEKTSTLHELGHRSMFSLFGIPSIRTVVNPSNPSENYYIDAQQAACRCNHVATSNAQHCLQSRHGISEAQVEGWGHYFAATTYNEGTDSNCTFIYYKEFREDNGAVINPPLAKSCFNQQRWQDNHCNAAGRGTEYDWMNFYWRLDNKDLYQPEEFSAVYRRACGNALCGGKVVPWSNLAAAATAQFGGTTPKGAAWSIQGANFGVNH